MGIWKKDIQRKKILDFILFKKKKKQSDDWKIIIKNKEDKKISEFSYEI